MKNALIYIFLLLGLSSAGCKKLSELTQFNINYTDTVTVQSMVGVNLPFNLYTPPISTNSESKFAINNTRKDMVEDIRLTSLVLRIIKPDGADFSFLKSIEIYISADSLPEVMAAWKDPIPDDTGSELDMETTADDLQEYIKADEFKLRVHSVTDEMILSDHDLEIDADFFVDARILGL